MPLSYKRIDKDKDQITIFYYDGIIFFLFLPKWDPFKKITNLGKSCQFGTTSYAEIVPIRHDFCMTRQKSYQVGTISI